MNILKTDKGIRVLQPLATSESRLEQEAKLKEQLIASGYSQVDAYVRNTDGELITCDRYHTPYVMKEYFEGKECNIRVESDMHLAVSNLADLHLAFRRIEIEDMQEIGSQKLLRTFARHNREMQRVRTYMRKKATKSEFDYLYLSCFDQFYNQGLAALHALEADEDVMQGRRLYYCHGAYNQHNVLLCKEGVATVNFDHFMIDNPLVDLYTFLRKVMEKNEYQPELVFRLIQTYTDKIPFDIQDYRFLYYLMWYPEKFWKISNQYNNMNKAWIAPKTYEKLDTILRQDAKKQKCLDAYRMRFHV
jgi:CotS family spore coat protein